MNIAIRAVSMATLLVVLIACDRGASAEEHIFRASQFIAGSEYGAAIIELKNALQKDSQSAEARWLLGKVYLDLGDVLSAEKELRRALELDWSRSDVIPALGESLLAQSKYAEVGKLNETELNPQAEISMLALKALAAMGLGNDEEAKKLANKALEKNPASPAALLAKARILSIQGDLAGAYTVLDTLLSSEPENGAAWGLAGDIRMGQQRPDEALVAFEKAVTFQRDNYSALLKRALLYLQLGNFEAAQDDAAALLHIAPQNPGANYVQGLNHFQAGRYGEAITTLSLAEPAFKKYPLVLFFLGSAQLMEGNLDQAAVQAVRFQSIAPESISGRKLLATIRLQQGKYGDVQELLRPVLEVNPDDVDALNLMSNALLRDGNTDEGITLLSRVAELQPDSPAAHVRLGAGLLIGGMESDATRHIETALELNPKFQQADILLVLNHLREQNYPAAIEAAETYRHRHLTSATPHNLLGRVYREAGQQDRARESFEKALTLNINDPAAHHNLAQMAISENDLARARQHYDTILEHHTNYLAALIQLAKLDAKEGNEQSLIAHLEQAIQTHPTAIQPRLLLGRYYLGRGRADKVSAVFVSLDELQRQSPQVLQLMALAQLSRKEHQAAQYTLEQLIETTTGTAPGHHMLAVSAAGSGDIPYAVQQLHRALEIDESYLPSRITLAGIALTNQSAEEFEQHLRKLEFLAPQNPEVLLLRAASAHRNGDTTAAMSLAEKSFKLAPHTSTVLTLAAYMETADNRDGVSQLYADWLDEQPNDIAVRMAMASSLHIAGEIDEARLHYEQVLEINPDNLVALNNLAWFLRQEDTEKALNYAHRASDISPESAEVLDTLALVEYENKDYKRAIRSIERALRASPDNPSINYHSALIAVALGDEASAKITLENLLGRNENFPEIKQANELLVELGN